MSAYMLDLTAQSTWLRTTERIYRRSNFVIPFGHIGSFMMKTKHFVLHSVNGSGIFKVTELVAAQRLLLVRSIKGVIWRSFVIFILFPFSLNVYTGV